MVQIIKDIVTWLKQWFYTESEVDVFINGLQSQINNKADASVVNNITNNVESKTVTVEEQSIAENGFLKTYVVKQGGMQVGSKINIPKDFLVKSATVKSATLPNVPVDGLSIGDKYIDFIINSKDNSSNDEHIYIKLSDIMDYSHFNNIYAPRDHVSSGATYGIGTTDKYGHVRIINGLTQAAHQSGLALSAYQGKVLKDLITEVDEELSNLQQLNANSIQYSPNPNDWGEATQVATNIANALTYLMQESNLKSYKNQTLGVNITLVDKGKTNEGCIIFNTIN